jgi:hypothetical protein
MATSRVNKKAPNALVAGVLGALLLFNSASASCISYTSGRASWYCKSGVSACHRDYPAGSMVAAACADLRAAIGANWRGKVVTVARRVSETTIIRIKVTLVDNCESTDKLIDLYAAPFSKLAPTWLGVARVRVSW